MNNELLLFNFIHYYFYILLFYLWYIRNIWFNIYNKFALICFHFTYLTAHILSGRACLGQGSTAHAQVRQILWEICVIILIV